MQYHPLRVARVIPETADARSFVLEVPADLAERFRYRAGQFLTFRVPLGGAEVARCYSLSSAPEVDARPQVTVKRVAEGRASDWFNSAVAEGDTLWVLPPAGRFVLRESTAPLVLFAAGSGITPVLSLIKSALASTARRVRVLYANRDAESTIFLRELDALAVAQPERLALVHHRDEVSGFVGSEQVAPQLVGAAGAHVYVCGPAPFMALVEEVARAKGVAAGDFFIERFESPADGKLPAELDGEPAAAGAPAEIVVRLDGKTHRIAYMPGQSILAAARAAGLSPPCACEEGYCGSCAAKCSAGEVTMAVNDVFNARELAEGWVLTCQGRAVRGPCEVSYDT